MTRIVPFHPRRSIAWAALLCGALAAIAPRPAAAIEICVQTLADLLDGLDEAGQFQADGTVTLRLVAQQYSWNGTRLILPLNRLNLLGGYNADCSARTVDPANTVINGLGQARLSLRRTALGITVEGVRFANMQELSTFDLGACADYGNTLSWRRTIVDGTPGFGISSDCGSIAFQNNVMRGGTSTQLGGSPETFQTDVFVTNNAFTGSGGDGLTLSRGADTQVVNVHLDNNVFRANAAADVALDGAAGGVPLVHARHNIWETAPVIALITNENNLVGDAMLDGDARPVAPNSPAINSGNNSPPGALPAVDIVGNPRIVGSAVDRGAYESGIVDTTELVVTHAGDSGAGSLRQAIIDANGLPDFNTIRFAIPGTFGAFLIPQSPYPDIVTPMRIDGFTQSGAQPNANAWSNAAEYRITISGGNQVSYAFRVPVNAPASASLDLRGFVIGGFTNAVLLQAGSGHRVRGNHFGKISDGVLGGSDNDNAIYVNSSANDVDIGGIDPAERNSIAGDPDPVAGAGYGIYLGGSGTGHLVAGNLIGTFPNGNTAHGHRVGMRIDSDLGVVMKNLISGNGTGVQLFGDDNLIASNRIGVRALAICLPPCVPDVALPNTHGIHVQSGATGNDINQNEVAWNDYSGLILFAGSRQTTLSANRVHANQTFDLDLREPAGINPIDGDGVLIGGCEEANCDQNFPQLDQAFGVRRAGRVRGSLSTTNGEYRLEFFAGATCGPGGQGGASTYLGARQVIVSGGSTFPPGNGTTLFDLPLSATASLYARFITATATSAGGNTSEYSACVAYACDQIFAHGFEAGAAEVCPAP